MQKSAITRKPENFTMKLFEDIIENYLKKEHFLSKHFLQLTDFADFQNLFNKCLVKNKKFLRDPSKGINSIFDEIINDLPTFSERFGNLLLDQILTTVNANEFIFTDSVSFERIFTGNRLLNKNHIHGEYQFINKEKLRFGSFISKDSEDSLPAIIVYETSSQSTDIVIQFIKILSKTFQEIFPEKELQIKDCYVNLLENYGKWLLKGKLNKKAKDKMSKDYSTLKEILNEILDQLNQIKNKKDKEIVSLEKSIGIINKSSYEAKSFPTFPGMVSEDSLQLLPPMNKETNHYIVPVVGKGWNLEMNSLYNLLRIKTIFENLLSLSSISEAIKKNIENVNNSINEFLLLFGIDPLIVTKDILELIYSLHDTDEQRENFYKLVLDHIKDLSGVMEFDCQFDKKNIREISLSTQNFVSNDNSKVIIFFNERQKNKEYPWQLNSYNILPDLILTLYLNAGIWPRSIEVFCTNIDYRINKDKSWKIGNGILRLVKAVIDAGVLKLLLDQKIKLNGTNNQNSKNPFLNIKENDNFLIIPILNRFQSERKGKTQIHKYYYDVKEALISYNRLTENKTILFKKKYEDKKILIETLFNKFKNVLNTHSDSLRFNVQMFEEIPLIKDFNDRLTLWKTLSENQQTEVWNLFNERSKQSYKKQPVYEVNFDNRNLKCDVSMISYITDEKQRLIPEKLFIHRLMGMKSGENSIIETLNKIRHKSDFKGRLTEYFNQDPTKKSITAMRGDLIRPGSVRSMFLSASNSIRRTAGLSMNIKLDDLPNYQNTSFLVVNVEGKPLNKTINYNELIRLLRITVFFYSLEKPPRVIFDDYFLKEPSKIVNYDKFFENIILEICYQSKLPVIVRAKNTPRTGEWFHDTMAKMMTVNQRSWKKLVDYTKLYEGEIRIWGFVKDFVSIPYLNLKTKNDDTRILGLSIKPIIFPGSSNEDDEVYQSRISLILKGTTKTRSSSFYAHASALICFYDPEKKLTKEEDNLNIELLILGASLGDEHGSLSLKGLERLFSYPYPDSSRKVLNPSLFINGVDIIEYTKSSEY